MLKDIKLFFLIFFIIFIISFLVFNGAAFFDLVDYKVNKLTEAIKEELIRSPSFLTSLPSNGEGLSLVSLKDYLLLQQPVISAAILPIIPSEAENSNILEMPQFGIKAPILQVETADSKVIYEKLKQGVVLYPSSDIPGEGYSIIIGHSSQYPWSPGKYKSVFSLLNELKQGDKIYVFWNQKPLVFEVKEKNIFLPWPKGTESTETVFPPSDEPTLILQSCWPVGIASKRVAIKAVLVR